MKATNHNIGNAGEYYVLSKMAQLGWIVAKTDDGQTLVDVIATHPDTLQSINIQVKTSKNGNCKWWMMSSKNEQHFASLWYVLIALGDPSEQPKCYTFHSSEVGPWIKADHQAWLDGKSSRRDSNVRRFRPKEDDLEAHRDNWGFGIANDTSDVEAPHG